MLGEPYDVGNSNTVVERPQLTAIDLQKGLQMVCDLVDNFFEVNNFMDRCLIFKHIMEAAMATFKKVYEDMQKWQSNQISTLSSTSLQSQILPFSLHHLITSTTSGKEHRHSNK
jgi:hypothetical protein